MNPVPYQKQLDEIIEGLEGKTPTLLLHACCAPCSSYCLEYLSKYFRITVFYYNPNITEYEEYEKRAEEEKRLIREMHFENPVQILEGPYEPKRYLEAVRGLEQEKEGGKRCEACFRLRLQKTAALASELGYDYFTTSLTISPLKNARLLNETGEEASSMYGVRFLPSDFKKKGGYQRSIELSKEYGLYRQNYCGCVFSKRDAESSKRIQNDA